MDNKIRVAIIGLGKNTPGKGGAHSIAYCHAWAYQATEGMEVVGACSRDAKNVADFIAEVSGCEGFQDYREMLEKLRPDLVSVCAFATAREEMVNAALDCGAKGVLIEKPIALTVEATKRMMAKAEKCGARLFVNHQRRYGKPFEAFLDASKNIGELLSVDITQPMANVLDFGPHLVDAALYVMGKERQAVSVFAAVDQSDPGQWQGISTESQLLGTAHFNDGSRILMEAGKDHCGKLPILRVNGSLGFAELHLEPAPDVTNVFRACLAGSSEITSLETSEHFHHSEDPALYMKRAVKDIRDALNTGIETRIDASEACRGIEILLGFFESAKSGKLLKL